MTEANSFERRSRTSRTRPGPEGRVVKTKKRARPALGVVTLYHFTTGEERVFHPVDANVQLKAGTYLRTPPAKPNPAKPVSEKPKVDPRVNAPESPHQAAIADEKPVKGKRTSKTSEAS